MSGTRTYLPGRPARQGRPRSHSTITGLLLGTGAALLGIDVGALPVDNSVTFVFIVIAFAFNLLTQPPRRFAGARLTPFDQVFVMFAVAKLLIEVVNATDLRHPIHPAVVIQPVFILLAYVTARMAISNAGDALRLLRAMVLPSIAVMVIGVLQVAGFVPVVRFLLQYTSSAGYHRRFEAGGEIRASSTIGHHTELAGYFLVITGICCVLLVLSKSLSRPRGLLWVVIASSIIGIMTTLTLAMIAFVVPLVILTVLRSGVSPKVVLGGSVGVGVAAGAGWFLRGADIARRLDETQIQKSDTFTWLPGTIAFRADVWVYETIPAILQRPLTGWGFDVYAAGVKGWPDRPASLLWLSPESEYFRTLVSFGVLGMAAQIVLFVVIWRTLRPLQLEKDDRRTDVTFPARTLFIMILLACTIHSHFASPSVPYTFFPLIGVVMALRAVAEPGLDASERRSQNHRG